MRDLTGDALERKIAQSLAPALTSGADVAVTHDDDLSLRWHCLPVADGIALHVREDSPAAREEAVIAMREAVRAALGRADIRQLDDVMRGTLSAQMFAQRGFRRCCFIRRQPARDCEAFASRLYRHRDP